MVDKPLRLFGYTNTDDQPCYKFCQELSPKNAHEGKCCTCFDRETIHPTTQSSSVSSDPAVTDAGMSDPNGTATEPNILDPIKKKSMYQKRYQYKTKMHVGIGIS